MALYLGSGNCATAPFLSGLLQWREDTPLAEQRCAGTAGCSGRWAHSREPNSRRITPSVCSDLIYDRDNRRWPGRLHLVRHEDSDDETRMAGLDAAAANAQAPTRPATPHAWRDGQPARGTRDLPWFKPLSHSWVERAKYNRTRTSLIFTIGSRWAQKLSCFDNSVWSEKN